MFGICENRKKTTAVEKTLPQLERKGREPMKRKAWVALCAAVLLGLSGCASLKAEYQKLDPPSRDTELTDEQILERIDNKTPYDKLLTKEIDIHRFVQRYDIYANGNFPLNVMAADEEMGVECLRLSPEGALYTVHKVRQGGLLYTFFDNFPEQYAKEPERAKSRTAIRWFYVQKNLSFADFAPIKEGVSTVGDVRRIDPTEQIAENLYAFDPQWYDRSGGTGSWHYLNDGWVEIGCQNENGTVTVKRVEYHPDYDLPQIREQSFPYTAKIWDMDRVK